LAKWYVASAHDISERLEQTLDAEIPRPVNLTVHIEPDLPVKVVKEIRNYLQKRKLESLNDIKGQVRLY